MQRQAGSWVSAGSDHGAGASTSLAKPHAWLGHAPFVFGLITAYLVLHFTLRLLLSPTLGIDDAEQVLFAQQWAWGYRFRQPPLFTWLLLPVIDGVGPGVLAVSLVRYALLAVTYGFFYLMALRWIEDRRLAALSVLSFSTIYVFAYYAHHDLTHTTALGAMIAAALLVFTRLSTRPSAINYGLLGLCFGLGMLAKWNFVMLAIGLPLTCLVMPDYRKLVLSWKCLLTVAVMAAIISPTALWMFSHGQSAGGVSSTILSGSSDLDQVDLMVRGASALLISMTLFPLPFLPIFLALFGTAITPTYRRQPPVDGTRSPFDPAFLGWLMLVTLGLHALLIPLFGAVTFTERWMHPALMVLPLYLFAVLARCRPPAKAISRYLWVIAILVAVVLGARLYRYVEGADECGKCREFVPFAELARDLRATGFKGGTIIADGMHVGGNLKMAFPESRVIDPAFPLALWPSLDDLHEPRDGMCLLIWRDDQPGASARRKLLHDFALSELDVPATATGESGHIEAALYRSSNRRYSLGYQLIQENAGGCR